MDVPRPDPSWLEYQGAAPPALSPELPQVAPTPIPVAKKSTAEMAVQTNPVFIKNYIPTFSQIGIQVATGPTPQDLFLSMVSSEEEMTRMETLADQRGEWQDIVALYEVSQRRAYEADQRAMLVQQERSSRLHIDMFENRQRETLIHHWAESSNEISMFLLISPRRSHSKKDSQTRGPASPVRSEIGDDVSLRGGVATLPATNRHSNSLSSDMAMLPLISPSPPTLKGGEPPKGLAPPAASPITTHTFTREVHESRVYVPSNGYVKERIEEIESGSKKSKPRRDPPPPPVERGLYSYQPSYNHNPPLQEPFSPPPDLRHGRTRPFQDEISIREASNRAMQSRLVNLQYI
jgi:hypothetical protein